MKIAFLFKKDSHFKAVKSTALRVCAQYNCESTFIGVDSQFIFNNEVNPVIYIDKERLNVLSEYDYVIACLGGYLLNRVITILRETSTKVISIFPGIVSHYQLDAFISRLNADQVWLNSRSDSELYSKICKLLNCPNNSILYGMSWLYQEDGIENDNLILQSEEAIFFEQTEILSSIERKRRFRNTIESLVLSNPQVKFKYKIRDNSTDKYFILLRNYLNQFENLDVVEKLTAIDISQAKYYLSVSSSALIEGIAFGKHSYIVDKELLDSDSREFYRNSDIELRNYVLNNISTPINNVWYTQRVSLPKNSVNLLSIHKKYSLVTIKSRNAQAIRLIIFKLAFFYPKFLHLAFNWPRVKAFQKSLEYLSK